MRNNAHMNEHKSQIIPIIDLIGQSDSEEFESNCTEVTYNK